jgi:hypothetical protein
MPQVHFGNLERIGTSPRPHHAAIVIVLGVIPVDPMTSFRQRVPLSRCLPCELS